MKYCWDKEEIEEKLNKSKKSDSSEIRKKATIYSRMLFDLNGNYVQDKTYIDKDIFFNRLDSFDIKYFDESFFKLMIYMGKYLTDFDEEFGLTNTDKKDPTEIVKTCRDFYKKIDKDSLVYFKKIIKKEDRIHFITKCSDYSFIGRSYIIDRSDFYILINGRNYLEDIKSLIHESKHIEMVMKGYDSGISLYQELASILYELYMLDYLEQTFENKSDVVMLKMSNLDKYVKKINSMVSQIEIIKKLKTDSYFYENIKTNYELYYNDYDLKDIFRVLLNGYSEKELGIIVSFVVALDIYLNSKFNNVNNVLSCYIFGMYKMKPSIIDNILEYIVSMYEPYFFDEQKIKKKYKISIDKH